MRIRSFPPRAQRSSNAVLLERSDLLAPRSSSVALDFSLEGGKAMKDNPEVGRGEKRKPYTKPEVREVTLTPEEAVLGFCKNSSVYGPVNTGFNNCSNLQCYGQGS